MEGTVRLFDEELHKQIPGMMERIAKDTAAAFRCTASLEYNILCDMLVNEPNMAALATASIEKVVGAGNVAPFRRTMGGEDFSAYTHIIPCAFAGLGGAGRPPSTAICSA